MANLSSWADPVNSFAYISGFGTEINSLASGSSVLSTVIITNTGASPNQFMDISFVGAIASTLVGAGSAISFFLACLQSDGTTYGDGQLTAGTAAVYNPIVWPIGAIPVVPVTRTSIIGNIGLIPIPPKNFRLVLQNNLLTVALASSGNSVGVSLYKQNLNA